MSQATGALKPGQPATMWSKMSPLLAPKSVQEEASEEPIKPVRCGSTSTQSHVIHGHVGEGHIVQKGTSDAISGATRRVDDQ